MRKGNLCKQENGAGSKPLAEHKTSERGGRAEKLARAVLRYSWMVALCIHAAAAVFLPPERYGIGF